MFYGDRLSVPHSASNLEHQVLELITSRDFGKLRISGPSLLVFTIIVSAKSDINNQHLRKPLQVARGHLACIALNICDNDVSAT